MAGRTFLVGIIAVFVLISLSCSTTQSVQEKSQNRIVSPLTPSVSWADSLYASMTLEQKVGQVIMVRVSGYYTASENEDVARTLRLIRDNGVGGVVLFQGDVYEAAHLLNELQSLAAVPLLVGADLERGLAMRIRRGTPFPDAMALGASRNPDLAYRVARAIAHEGRALGIHQNYAPVADINTNPANPVINTRAFGDDVALVQKMVAAFVRGTNDGGMLSTTKHFPGHGDTGRDSHLELPIVTLTRPRLDSVELSPFRMAIQNGTKSVMIAHITVPALENGRARPASLSTDIISGVLRKELGFSGLVVSDAMEMQGVMRDYSVGESTVMALQAGTDIVLLPRDADVAVNAIVAAVKSGALPEESVNMSVRRILKTKQALGLNENRFADYGSISGVVGTPRHWQLAREVSRNAITLLRDNGAALPLLRFEGRRVLSVTLTDLEDSQNEIDRQGAARVCEPTGSYFTNLLSRRLGRLESVRLTPTSEQSDFDAALKKVKGADLVILSTYVKVRSSSGRIGLPDRLHDFLDSERRLKKSTVAVTFGSPYISAFFPEVDALVCAYGDEEPLIEATAEGLCGEVGFHGKLPVTIPGAFSFGSGIARPPQRLRHADPAEAGFDPGRLRRIDSIALAGIRDSAFSAAQIAIVKDGILVWDKSYGTYSYDAASREIGPTSLFDLASLTKVVATTTAVMKLYDQQKIRLDDPVSMYIPQFAQGPKAAVTIRHLLLHRGGFPPFRKFWEFASPSTVLDSVFATPLVATPGDTTIYSDLGFITLGKVVEKVSGVSLADFMRKWFFGPLGMDNTMYAPPEEIRTRAVATERDTTWRRRMIQGTVHDENAAFLGGISGHAGLFSTAGDLAVFVQMLLNGGVYDGVRFLSDTTIDRFIKVKLAGQERFLGWDMKSAKGSSAGTLFSPSSFGHTGFTGTSVWVDPARRLGVIFLTNRVHPTRMNSKLFRIRPALHNAVISSLN
jgi:beta-glucosidase-like glycosyl hydrolase/CubicO group peptidase (beta-lactamase class C family)